MGDWWRKFRAFDSRGLLIARVDGRFAFTKSGYVVDRRIFQAYVGAVVVALFLIGIQSGVGWSEAYTHCPVDAVGKCWNPCFGEGGRCAVISGQEFLSPGESLGTPMKPWFDDALRGVGWGAVAGVVVAFLLNHFVHNRGRPFAQLFSSLEVE